MKMTKVVKKLLVSYKNTFCLQTSRTWIKKYHARILSAEEFSWKIFFFFLKSGRFSYSCFLAETVMNSGMTFPSFIPFIYSSFSLGEWHSLRSGAHKNCFYELRLIEIVVWSELDIVLTINETLMLQYRHYMPVSECLQSHNSYVPWMHHQ